MPRMRRDHQFTVLESEPLFEETLEVENPHPGVEVLEHLDVGGGCTPRWTWMSGTQWGASTTF